VDNLDVLAKALRPGVELVILDESRNGLEQIASWLATHQGVTAVHVVSHGRTGGVSLGNLWLDSAGISDYQEILSSIGRFLPAGADLLLYGCNVGGGKEGSTFLDLLAAATGVDVAASDDLTGSSWLGGDWVLEAQRGIVNTDTAFVSTELTFYQGLLAVSDHNLNSFQSNLILEAQFLEPGLFKAFPTPIQ
jgi:hypothetical protein